MPSGQLRINPKILYSRARTGSRFKSQKTCTRCSRTGWSITVQGRMVSLCDQPILTRTTSYPERTRMTAPLAGALNVNTGRAHPMRTSTPLDEILWKQYRSQSPRPVPAKLHAPRNYVELAALIDFDAEEEDLCNPSRAAAWSSFLHAFFYYKSASFFEERPPDIVPVEEQALWAGTAEGFCHKLDLPVPEWTCDSRYFLAQPWDSSVLYAILDSPITSGSLNRTRNFVAATLWLGSGISWWRRRRPHANEVDDRHQSRPGRRRP